MNNLKFALFTLLLVMMGSAACTNSGDDNVPAGDLPEVLNNSGLWRVSYFWDKTKEETHKFFGYTFKFNPDGSLVATKDDDITFGNWQISSGSHKFIIEIDGDTGPLDELEDDWIILESNEQTIKLKDDNDEHLEELHFEAI